MADASSRRPHRIWLQELLSPVLIKSFMWDRLMRNPTIRGTKCEETTYLTDENVEIFTRTKEWPFTVDFRYKGAFNELIFTENKSI